jgi:hypothetical protein
MSDTSHIVTNKSSQDLTSVTNIVSANKSRTVLRIKNKSDRIPLYVSQNSGMTISSAGNQVLQPSDALLVEGTAAGVAWYAIAPANSPNTGACNYSTDEVDPR